MTDEARTSRGFDAPRGMPESLSHVADRFIIVRLTPWELRQVKVGTSYPDPKTVRFLPRDDGTYDAVAYDSASR